MSVIEGADVAMGEGAGVGVGAGVWADTGVVIMVTGNARRLQMRKTRIEMYPVTIIMFSSIMNCTYKRSY
jgi:hypothetical protein